MNGYTNAHFAELPEGSSPRTSTSEVKERKQLISSKACGKHSGGTVADVHTANNPSTSLRPRFLSDPNSNSVPRLPWPRWPR